VPALRIVRFPKQLIGGNGHSGTNTSPASHALVQCCLVNWPVMHHRWIKVSPVRPHQRLYLWINFHRVKNRGLPQWTEDLANEHRLEIDRPQKPIIEFNRQRVRSHDLEVRDTVDGVFHDSILAALLLSAPFLVATLPNRLT